MTLMGSQSKKDSKRKRSWSELPQNNETKRTATGDSKDSGALGEKARQREEIRKIYESYLLLCSKTSKGDVTAFDFLLNKSKGFLGEQRLVSVLIPRFAPTFPDKTESVLSSLLALSTPSAEREFDPATADASCLSALHGLGAVCTAAAKKGQEKAVAKGVEHLLRELSLASSSRTDSHQRQRASDQGRPDPDRSSDRASAIASSLVAIFKRAPQQTLSICSRGLQKGHGDLYHGSKRFMIVVLLRPSDADATSYTNGKDVAMSEGGCVAARVLESMPDVQHWIKETIADFQHGKPSGKGTGEVAQNFARLLEALPPAASGSAKSPVLELSVATSPAQPTQDVQPSPLVSPFAGHGDGEPRSGSMSHVELPVEASGQNDPHGQTAIDEGLERASRPTFATVSINPEQLRPGGDVCLASSILWLTGIPPGLSDAAIKAECNSFGSVSDVLQPTSAPPDEAFVVFADMRDAACCYEAMCDAPVWGLLRSSVRFCERPAVTPGFDEADGKVHVWVGGVGSSRGEEGVLRRLADTGVAAPVSILRVAGSRPGLILQYPTAAQGAMAVWALDRDNPPLGRQPPAGLMQPGPSSAGRSRTLWVGQVGPAVNEDRLIAAFREYGMVTGWKFLRRSNCAFIDFDAPGSAAAALEALHGANFNGCQIRIEFKDERGHPMPMRGRGSLLHGGRFQAAADSPGRPGWLPSHRSGGSRAGPSPPRRPRFTREQSPQAPWPPSASLDQGSARLSVQPSGFQDPHGFMQDDLRRGRSLADHASPNQLQGVRLDERPSFPIQSRRSSKVSKWDVEAGRPDTYSGQQNADILPAPPTSMQRRASVEEGQIPVPPELPAISSRPNSAEAGTGTRWKGMLAKSGSPVCEMICTTETTSSLRELQNWPDTLDVTVRADLSYVLSNVSAMSAVLCLAPAPQLDADRRMRQRGMFIDFINNLSSRSRAGVVKGLPAVDPTVGPRTLYLVPPSVSVSERLRVAWDNKECVFAVVMPASLN